MPITTFSGRQFNQFSSEAKRAANNGPVFITDRGKPAHVLISFDEYQKMTHQQRNIADAISMSVDIDFEALALKIETKEVDFS